jgi:hypothetical protein
LIDEALKSNPSSEQARERVGADTTAAAYSETAKASTLRKWRTPVSFWPVQCSEGGLFNATRNVLKLRDHGL